MSEIPESDALKAIDRETFRAMRRDPAKLEAHLDTMLSAVHNRMMAPFQKSQPVSYHTFSKAPVVDMSKLVKMPVSGKAADAQNTTAPQPVSPTPPEASPTAPETAHPPAPKSTVTFPPSSPKGTVVEKSSVTSPRGTIHDDLPDTAPQSPLHTDVPAPAKPQKAQSPKAAPVDTKSDMPESSLVAPKSADADAVKKRFEERQAGLDGLFKDKGKLT